MNIIELSEIVKTLEIDPADSFEFINGDSLLGRHTLFHSPDIHSIYEIKNDNELKIKITEIIKNSLLNIKDILLTFQINKKWTQISIEELNKTTINNDIEKFYLYIPPQKQGKDIRAFIELIAHLRAPEGCPWDRKQTHQSLRTNLLEETYEVLDAIDNASSEDLKEELGDLLLQIVLHAQISQEAGEFTFEQIVNDIHYKIKHRHPHVFEDVNVDGVGGVMKNWERIKEKERSEIPRKNKSSILSSIPGQLPALSIAQKYQERASRVGFDWEEISPVFEKILEEIDEVRKADPENGLEEELGDLLFAVVNLVRWSGFDAENALRLTNKKFRRRFNFIEKKISESERSLTDVSLSEMDAFWEQAKREENL